MRLQLAAAALLAATGATFAQAPPMPSDSTDPEKCIWEWKQDALPDGGSIGVWAERCRFDSRVWAPSFNPDLPGFELTIDGHPEFTVIQVFAKPAEADVSAILPELRERGYIPDDDECIFEPASDATPQTIGPAPRTRAFYEIMPTGARLEAFEATPSDEVPDPPCGRYGWSTHGVRFFMTDLAYPIGVIYMDLGQDGALFDPATIRLE
jgi:hypothetical protein